MKMKCLNKLKSSLNNIKIFFGIIKKVHHKIDRFLKNEREGFITVLLLQAALIVCYAIFFEAQAYVLLRYIMTDPSVLEYTTEKSQTETILISENINNSDSQISDEGLPFDLSLVPLIQVSEKNDQFEIALQLDYFNTPERQDEDVDLTYKDALAAIVHLYDKDLNTNGGGFIMKITQDFIYIVTNYHVAQYMEEAAKVYFSKNVWGQAEYLGKDDFFDVAVFRVKTNELTINQLLNLKEIHINPEAMDVLDSDNHLFMAAEFYNEGNFYASGTLLQEYASIPNLPQPYTMTSLSSRPGVSGSPILDYKGNLIGMNYGRYWPSGNDVYYNIAIPLHYLIESFTEITGVVLE